MSLNTSIKTSIKNNISVLSLIPDYIEKTYYLDNEHKCWIKIYKDKILENIDFYKVYEDMYDGNTFIINTNPIDNQYHNFNANRAYKTFGAIPLYKNTNKMTNMYCSLETIHTSHPINKTWYVNDIVNHFDCKYNNVVVNCYKDGNDYIPFHKDCEEQMPDDKGICIVTLTPTSLNDECDTDTTDTTDYRTLIFKNDVKTSNIYNLDIKYNYVNIKTQNGCVVIIGGETNKFFRHGVKKQNTTKPRISISLRTIML